RRPKRKLRTGPLAGCSFPVSRFRFSIFLSGLEFPPLCHHHGTEACPELVEGRVRVEAVLRKPAFFRPQGGGRLVEALRLQARGWSCGGRSGWRRSHSAKARPTMATIAQTMTVPMK